MAVLDADFLIALEARDAKAVDWLKEHRDEALCVPDFVAVEYLTGHSSPDDALVALDAAFTLLHGDQGWVRSAVALRRALRKKGVKVRISHFWIGAWAIHLGTTVVTRDRRHFQPLGVDVTTWWSAMRGGIWSLSAQLLRAVAMVSRPPTSTGLP